MPKYGAPEDYLRDDIYFCPDCQQFHNARDSRVVDIPLTELPAEVTLDILLLKNGVLRRNPPNGDGKASKGFGKK